MSKYVPIHLDEIEYVGSTREERRLNKELLETILELNSYQDSYDKMKTIEEVKNRIEVLKQLVSEEYIPIDEYNSYQGEIKALEWVLSGSKTFDEKMEPFKATRKDVESLIHKLNEDYKQMSIFDYGDEDEENKSN